MRGVRLYENLSIRRYLSVEVKIMVWKSVRVELHGAEKLDPIQI